MGARPRVLVLADRPDWAWATKSRAYALYLSDEFAITIGYQTAVDFDWFAFDLIHCFEVSQLNHVPRDLPQSTRLIAGMTALVSATWGEERMHAWAARCDALHGNSLQIVEVLKPFHHTVAYTPNGVDADFWHRLRPRPPGPLVACHVGKPNPRKGGALIIEACHRVGMKLLLCQRTAHIRLSPEKIRDLYQDSHVYLTMSDFDGTPNCALESAACENAQVGTAIGNLPQIVRDGGNGFLVERTVDALAKKLAWCRDRPADVVAMGQQARADILAGWTWTRQVEHVRALWRSLL